MKYTLIFTIFIFYLCLNIIFCLSRKRKVLSKRKVGTKPKVGNFKQEQLFQDFDGNDFFGTLKLIY